MGISGGALRRTSGRLLRLSGTAAWCWALWRLVARPGDSGPLEASLAASGWGLSVIPVHVTPRGRTSRPQRSGAGRPGSAPPGSAHSGSTWQPGHQ